MPMPTWLALFIGFTAGWFVTSTHYKIAIIYGNIPNPKP